ncbi:unnamed protein product [Paramecium sonneborni]|uniref:Uncharacterized protein n=1 Tax=Paramecium sonneborni TaxID=65129 RepID=A0A8S1Q830_9CILI|nr:unnamed protein product [Paramecium sonneborni]
MDIKRNKIFILQNNEEYNQLQNKLEIDHSQSCHTQKQEGKMQIIIISLDSLSKMMDNIFLMQEFEN